MSGMLVTASGDRVAIPAAVYRSPQSASKPQLFKPGDLVTWNGWNGTVRSYPQPGIVRVGFGGNRMKNVPEDHLSVFVPWWGERD